MKNNRKISTDNLKLARIKYFDLEHNGVEVTSDDPFVFLFKVKDTYVNLFDPCEDFTVYERIPYSNVSKDGEDFGTKIGLLQGKVDEGLCYVIENVNLKHYFGKEEINISDLIKYMINSKDFFIDRMDYILESSSFKFNNKLRAKYYDDCKRLDDFKYFVNSHDKGVQYIK